MPGAAVSAARGRLPGVEREGSVAWLEFTSLVDMEHAYVAVVLPARSAGRLPERWVDESDVGVQAFSEGLAVPALERAAAGGYGLSTSAGGVCVYLETTNETTPGERIEQLIRDAAEIADLLEAEAG